MGRLPRHRELAAGLALLLGAAALSAAPILPVAADTGVEGRVLTVGPATNLTQGVVQVSWTGFRPTRRVDNVYAVNVAQCTAAPQTLADCYTAARYPSIGNGSIVTGVVTKADGTGATTLEVRNTATLADGRELRCNATTPCSILAWEITGQPDPIDRLPDAYAIADITFAPSPADCPAVQDFDARIGGEPSTAPLLYRLAGQECTAANPSRLDVTETSSTEGRDAVLEQQVDVGITSVAATTDELGRHPEVQRVRYAPVDLTGVVVAFNMRNPVTGARITSMNLSPRLVARLISATRLDDFFGDPEFRALNPGLRFPSAGVTYPHLRAESNADTSLVTGWLQQDAAARRFLDGADTPFGVTVNDGWLRVPYPTDIFESRSSENGYVPRTGQRSVALGVYYAATPTGSAVSSDFKGVIGVMDWPTALRYGLATASIVNAAGTPVAPTTESVLAGYRAMRPNADGTRSTDFSSTDPSAYPLTKVDYAMVTNTIGTSRIPTVAGVLEDLVGPSQDAGVAGYVPLPAELRDQTRSISARLTALVTGIDDTPTTPTVPTDGTGSAGYTSGGGGSILGGVDAGPATPAPARPGRTVHRGLSRFTPIVAFPGTSSTATLPVILALGILAALAAVAPAAWSAARRRLGR
jgi:ABC-type phosphate transport system substrate-binding protein